MPVRHGVVGTSNDLSATWGCRDRKKPGTFLRVSIGDGSTISGLRFEESCSQRFRTFTINLDITGYEEMPLLHSGDTFLEPCNQAVPRCMAFCGRTFHSKAPAAPQSSGGPNCGYEIISS